MFFAKWIVPMVCASTAVLAQTTSDLNGLVSAADHYVSSGMSGDRDPQMLALSKVTGDMGSAYPGFLMTKATDVQHWTFLYRINTGHPMPPKDFSDPTLPPTQAPSQAPGQPPATPHHMAVLADCTKGVFNSFRYSDSAIKGLKSLEFTWVAVPLDTAILSLNANGYTRGFTTVELMRPDLAGYPDDFVYVFNCPWERQEVAVSCQTGALAWTYGY